MENPKVTILTNLQVNLRQHSAYASYVLKDDTDCG